MGNAFSHHREMNSTGSENIIKLEGYEIRIPQILSKDGEHDGILFEKPSWTPDEEATLCFNCQQSFSRLRRKHHCRNCGKIFCNKCCNDKVVMLQFGLKDTQIVCDSCKTAAVLVSKSRSATKSVRDECALGLSKLAFNIPDLRKLIESGGLYVMLHLAIHGDIAVKAAVASALISIARHSVFNVYLVEGGCLTLFSQVLTTCKGGEYLVVIDTLEALCLLCQDQNIKLQALSENLVDPLLSILSNSGTTSLIASRVLLILFDNLNYHECIVKNHPSIISSLLRFLRGRNPQGGDYHIGEAITKMLVYLSSGSETARLLLLQEDEVLGSPLIFLLKKSPPEVITNVSCIIANMAVASKELRFAHKYITVFCELLDVVHKEAVAIITHLGRGLANFSECPTNILVLIQHLPSIVSTLMQSNNETHRYHGCRIIIRLLSAEPTCTLRVLSSNGIDPFLGTLFSLPGVNDSLISILMQKVSRLSMAT